MKAQLQDQVAVITGSTGGMGEGIARRLAGDGASVVISGRRAEQGRQVADDIARSGAPAMFVPADMGVEADCINLIHATLERFSRLDILVNNAAATPVEPPGAQTGELWDQVFAVNTRGPWACCREAIPVMRRQGGGRIINIGTTMPFKGGLDRLAYGCSKGALYFMTKMLARDLARDRILVNWITVGWVATPGELALRDITHGDGASYITQMAPKMPLGRLGSVEDIAAGVAFLASDAAGHITGGELNISGGLLV